jgi:hypothetical protein
MNAIANRRRLLLGALTAGAAVSVAAVPAVASPAEPDAVLALIEAHRAAWAHYIALPEDLPWAAEQEGAGVCDAALDAIMETRPSTLTGMREVLQHLVDLDNDGNGYELGAKYLPALLRSPG